MRCICVITARGGSKRIPRKNIRDFCGRPIISYPIEAALESNIFDEVMVSTDDEEIAEIAIRYGASVPFLRDKGTSGDYATTSDVLQEVLSRYEAEGKIFDLLFCIYPTAPFVTSEHLTEAYRQLLSGADSVAPVVRYSHPPQRGLIVSGDRLCYMYPEYRNVRSQDLPPVYHDPGQFYACRVSQFQDAGSLYAGSCRAIVLSETEVQDIDTEDDWALAELKFKRSNLWKS